MRWRAQYIAGLSTRRRGACWGRRATAHIDSESRVQARYYQTMAEAEARSILALRYMLDFRCIGGDCEDSCCESGWSIYIDPDHLVKLRRALPREPQPDPAALPSFDQTVRMLPKSERSDRAAAQLILDEKGRRFSE
jgi:hypothetical protein